VDACLFYRSGHRTAKTAAGSSLARDRRGTVSRPVGHLHRCPRGLPWISCFDTLSRELKRVEAEAIYQKRVFFIQNLGFITPTEARRISFEESLRFERLHEEIYRNSGFELVPIAPGSLLDRVDAIKRSAPSYNLRL
jgi:predicted ATPase